MEFVPPEKVVKLDWNGNTIVAFISLLDGLQLLCAKALARDRFLLRILKILIQFRTKGGYIDPTSFD